MTSGMSGNFNLLTFGCFFSFFSVLYRLWCFSRNSNNFSLSNYWLDFLFIPFAFTNLLTKTVDWSFFNLRYLGWEEEIISNSLFYFLFSSNLLYASISFKQVSFNNFNSWSALNSTKSSLTSSYIWLSI